MDHINRYFSIDLAEIVLTLAGTECNNMQCQHQILCGIRKKPSFLIVSRPIHMGDFCPIGLQNVCESTVCWHVMFLSQRMRCQNSCEPVDCHHHQPCPRSRMWVSKLFSGVFHNFLWTSKYAVSRKVYLLYYLLLSHFYLGQNGTPSQTDLFKLKCSVKLQLLSQLAKNPQRRYVAYCNVW